MLCFQEAIESIELDTVLNLDVHSKLHVLYGGTKVVQHTPPSKSGPGLKGIFFLHLLLSLDFDVEFVDSLIGSNNMSQY